MGVGSRRLDEFLGALAATTPTPGGGAVAPVVGALASALARMVVAYSVDRKSLAEHRPALEDASARLARAEMLLLELADADAAAYAVLNAAMKRPRDDPQRAAAVAAAAGDAVAPPRAAMALGIDLLRLLEELAARTNPMLASDLRIAAILAEALVRAAAENVRANLRLLSDADSAATLAAECEHSCDESIRRSLNVRGAAAP
jgi:formiminotetrahydrofolate cyclodeaminase